MAKLTRAQRKMLSSAERSSLQGFDGVIPHGGGAWRAARMLLQAGLLRDEGVGECGWDDCPRRRDGHEGSVLSLTDAGRAALAAEPTDPEAQS